MTNSMAVDLTSIKGGGHHTVKLENLIEGIWAITKFIYLGDTTVEFVRYTTSAPDASLSSGPSPPLPSLRCYNVEEKMSAVEVAMEGHTNDNALADALDVATRDTLPVNITSLVKQVTVQITDGSGAEFEQDPRVKKVRITMNPRGPIATKYMVARCSVRYLCIRRYRCRDLPLLWGFCL